LILLDTGTYGANQEWAYRTGFTFDEVAGSSSLLAASHQQTGLDALCPMFEEPGLNFTGDRGFENPSPSSAEACANFASSGDTLIVWKLDRLARSMKQLIETIETLRVRGIGFRSLTEALDTTIAQGRLVFHMFGALAEFERSLIRKRTQSGLAAARRAGRREAVRQNSPTTTSRLPRPMQANPDIGVNSNRAPPRRLTGDALSVHPGRANREYAGV
jgi:hypothetical protein